MEQRFIFQQRKSEDKMASFFSKQLDTFMNRMGRPSSSAAASTVDSVDLRLNEEHGNFEDESLLDDDQITPAQPQHRDALEFLIAGASAVGVGTALFYDPLICIKINEGIADYLRSHGFSSVAELTGTLNLNSPEHAGCNR